MKTLHLIASKYMSKHASCWMLALATLIVSCNTPGRPRTSGQTKPKTPAQQLPVNAGEPTVQHVNAASGHGEPVLVSITGWNSCVSTAENATPNPYGMNNYTGFKLMRSRVEALTGKKTRFVISCFSPNISTVRYYSSSAPDILREGPIQHLYDEITKQTTEGRGSAFINGHSYGGWFAMQSALSLPDSVRLGLLSTMDAISPKACDALQMKNIAASLLDMKLPPTSQGCGVSPEDITTEQKAKIRSRAAIWYNFFQIDFLNALHATAIAEAHQNIEVKYPFPKNVNGHINMGLDEKVWTTLAEKISAEIQK